MRLYSGGIGSLWSAAFVFTMNTGLGTNGNWNQQNTCSNRNRGGVSRGVYSDVIATKCYDKRTNAAAVTDNRLHRSMITVDWSRDRWMQMIGRWSPRHGAYSYYHYLGNINTTKEL